MQSHGKEEAVMQDGVEAAGPWSFAEATTGLISLWCKSIRQVMVFIYGYLHINRPFDVSPHAEISTDYFS